jgi:hypothetical protein
MLSRTYKNAATALVAAMMWHLTASAPALGQTPGTPGHVTIVSRPAAESLRAPRRTTSRPPMMARPAFEFQSWFDRTEGPAALPPSPQGAVVIARELTLANRHYLLDTPLLVIVADRLRIGPNAVIDVSGKPRAAGGKIVVLTRNLTCESGGSLQLIARAVPWEARAAQ